MPLCTQNNLTCTCLPIIYVFCLHSLKVINHYRHASIQMGDKAFYIVKESDLQLVANTVGKNSITQSQDDDHGSKQTQSSTETKTTSEEGESKTPLGDSQQKGITNDDSGPTGALTDSTDEDPEGGDHGAPKTKGTSQGSKHDTGPSGARAKRRRKRAKRKRKAMPHMEVNVGDRVCVEVASTCTKINVVWQNRTETVGIPSTHLTPVFHLDEHEFFPGDFASDKRGKRLGVLNQYTMVLYNIIIIIIIALHVWWSVYLLIIHY